MLIHLRLHTSLMVEQGLVGKGGALADAPGANVIAGVLDSLSLKDRPQGVSHIQHVKELSLFHSTSITRL